MRIARRVIVNVKPPVPAVGHEQTQTATGTVTNTTWQDMNTLEYVSVAAGAELLLASLSVTPVNPTNVCYYAGSSCAFEYYIETSRFKMRLYVDGVQKAESGYMTNNYMRIITYHEVNRPTTTHNVELKAHNYYSGASRICQYTTAAGGGNREFPGGAISFFEAKAA